MKKVYDSFHISDIQCQSIHYSSSYNILWMDSEQQQILNGKYILVGHGTNVWWSKNRRSWLANRPNALLVRKILKSGKISPQLFSWPFEDNKNQVPCELNEHFWKIFPSLMAYSIYDKHQLKIAEKNVEEYCGYGSPSIPEVVSHWMNDNKYFWELSTANKIDRENRIADAKNCGLELQSQLFADENLSGIFDSMMQPIDVQKENLDFMSQLRILDKKISSLNHEIYSAHKYEDMSSERSICLKLEQQFNKLVKEHFEEIPKNGLGMISLYFIQP